MGIKFFGQYLLEKGVITREQLLEAVEYQKEVNLSVGTLSIEKGYLTAQQVEKIHKEQYRTDKKFGEIAIDFGYLDQAKLNEILEVQKTRRVYLGEALVQKGFLTLSQLEKELKLYKEEQEKVEIEVITVLKNVKSLQIAEVFVDIAIKMFLRLIGEIVKIKECSLSKEKFATFPWTFSQKVIGGEEIFNFLLNIPEHLLLKIASRMMKKDIQKPDEISLDAVAEFTNIITGNTCAKMSTMEVKLKAQPPVVHNNLSGEKYNLSGKYISTIDLVSTIGDFQIAVEVF